MSVHESRLTEQQLVSRFVEALRALPEVEAELEHQKAAGRQGDLGHDEQVDLRVAGKSFVLVGCAVRLAVAVMAALFAWRIGRLALLAVRLSNLEFPGLPVVTATWETAVAEVLVSILRSTSFCLGEP